MTEEIIIDGVDVSECEKLGETIDGITCGLGKRIRFANEIITKHNLCKNNPNCYYKQLKRKEQELQEAMDNYIKLDNQRVKEYNELVDKYNNKEQECEKIKQNAQDTYDLWQALIESFNILQGEKIKLEQECEKLKSELSETIGTIDNVRKAKEYYQQECEEFKKELHKNFEEKDKLHLIIDRLLEASGYDTNTASAEDFEDVYENMCYKQQQLDQYKQALAEIEEIADKDFRHTAWEEYAKQLKQILQKISECEVNNE